MSGPSRRSNRVALLPRSGARAGAALRPMVETSGLTRSKGRVSQAGKTSTRAPSRPASGNEGPEVVGQLFGADARWGSPPGPADGSPAGPGRPGRRPAPGWRRPGWHRTADTRVMAGSLRSRAGSERRLTRSGYRGRTRASVVVDRAARRGSAADAGADAAGPVIRRAVAGIELVHGGGRAVGTMSSTAWAASSMADEQDLALGRARAASGRSPLRAGGRAVFRCPPAPGGTDWCGDGSRWT